VNDPPIIVGPFIMPVPEEYQHPPRPPFRPLQDPIFTIPWHDDDAGQIHSFQVLSGNVGAFRPVGTPHSTFVMLSLRHLTHRDTLVSSPARKRDGASPTAAVIAFSTVTQIRRATPGSCTSLAMAPSGRHESWTMRDLTPFCTP
jgi:hypothetical protein